MICDSREIVKFGFSEKNTSYKKILYLGTHITQRSLDCGFYYFGVSNWFWNVIKEIYRSEKLSRLIDNYKEQITTFKKTKHLNGVNIIKARDELIECLQEHGIVINDILGYCECDGSKDDQIIEDKSLPNDGTNGFHDVPLLIKEADIVVVNGKGLKNGKVMPLSVRYFLDKYNYNHLTDPSKIKYVYGTTPGAPGFKAKVEDWKNIIGKVKK